METKDHSKNGANLKSQVRKGKNMKNFNINRISEPRLYIRNGKSCYFDPVTKCLRIKTPEEEVRQKLLVYLHNELEIPNSAIEVEVPLSHYQKGVCGRADVVIYRSIDNENEIKVPVAVIECKSPDIVIVDSVHEQVSHYASQLDVGLIGITNGSSLDLIYLDGKTQKYNMIKDIPKYENMCDPSKLHLIPFVEPVRDRYKFEDICNHEKFIDAQNNGYIGENTPTEFSQFLMNLIVGLLYTERGTEYSLHIDGYKYIQDLGIRYASFGNAGGGSYPGDYRAFMVTDKFGNSQIISISLFSVGTLKGMINNPTISGGKRRGGYTSLIVAIDDFDKHHNALQLNLDDCIRLKGNQAEIYHNGKITIGSKGSAKPSELIEFIKQNDDTLLHGNQVYLGTLDFSQPLNMGVEIFRNFLEKLVSYAFLRDEFRAQFKSR